MGKINFTFVFRHRFERHDISAHQFRSDMVWRNWELGLWYKRSKMVGQKNFNHPSKWKNNLVRSYMIGINLLICKAWVEFNKGGMQIPE